MRFPEAGTFFYAGEAMANGAILSGVVEVSEPEEKAYEVKVTLGDFEAEYDVFSEEGKGNGGKERVR